MADAGFRQFFNRRMKWEIVAEAPSSFTYYSASFNASPYLSRGANFTGLSDGDKGTVSFWLKMAVGSSDTTQYNLLYGGNSRFLLRRATTGKIELACRNTANSVVLSKASSTSVNIAAGWVHVIASWDLSTAGRFKMYINGSDEGAADTFTASETIDYTEGNWYVAGWGASGQLNGLLCEFYFTNEYLDLSVQATREKFRTSGGKPENLGADGSTPTGTQPILYLHDEVPDWETNLGSGGGMTENGTINNGGGDIP